MSVLTIKDVPCTVTVIDHEYSEITFTLPNNMIRPMKFFMESFAELFAGIAWKVKIDRHTIDHNSVAQIEVAQTEYEKYTNDVQSVYQKNVLSGMQPDAAFKQTTREIKLMYPSSSYDRVRNILIKSGAFKKSGFYGKKVVAM